MTAPQHHVPIAVEAALHAYGLDGAEVAFVVDSFNTIYRIDGSCALRLGPHEAIHTDGSAAAELDWTAELAAAGITVPRVIRTRAGGASVTVADEAGAREAMLLTWVDGERLALPPDPRDAPDVGVLAARLHDASPARPIRPSGVLGGDRALLFDGPNRLAEASGNTRDVLLAAHRLAQAGLDRLWREAAEPPRILHGDLTPNNLVRGAAGLVAIDFQDMTWGHPQQDIANALYGLTRGVGMTPVLAELRAGYETVRPWPRLTPELLADLVAARRLTMANLAITTRRHDLDEYLRGHADALRGYVEGA